MKVIDAFTFFNELDLLEIRLHEMAPLVDHFVIVEALEPHGSGKRRDAVLKANWHVVKPFESKVHYVLLPKLVPPFVNYDTSFLRENYQRNCLMSGVHDVSTSPDDVVIISDCDEIPRRAAVHGLIQSGRLSAGIHHLLQDFFYYNVNWFLYPDWNPACVGTVAQIGKMGGAERARRANTPNKVRLGGWHFSYFGGVSRIRLKLESFLEATEADCKEVLRRGDAQLAADIAAGKNIYRDRAKLTWREANDPRLPQYFLSNLERFRHLTAAGFK